MRPAILALILATASVVSIDAQQNVPPPPKPPDNGPSLEVTMKFIQDKMNEQGRVGYAYTQSNLNGVTFRVFYRADDP